MKKDLRIVFMGSPEFAVASLDALTTANYTVVGVVTAPDKIAGRGKQIRKTAVKEYAETKGLKLLQPANLKDSQFIAELSDLNANLGVVVAFRMLPEIVWSYPQLGTFNLHASLLPQYRGAAPINHAIINGETETGITTFFLQHEIDTGHIIYQEKLPIGEKETFGELHDRLMKAGADLVLKTVKSIENQSVRLIPQNELISPGEIIKPAPKIYKENCRIDWKKSAKEVFDLVRGLNPAPAAYTHLISPDGDEIQMKVLKTSFEEIAHEEQAGNIRTNSKNEFVVFARDGIISIEELQLAGKKCLPVTDFLNGFRLTSSWKVI